jgi:WS/DGAT/MGAT family acyltransferase
MPGPIAASPPAPIVAARRRRPPTRLSAADTVLWQIERDPVLRSTITAVAMLDRAPDLDLLRRRLGSVIEAVPRLRERIVPGAAPGVAWWVEVDELDLDYHLRHATVPAPGGDRELLELVRPWSVTPFDPERPLWEFTLVDGLRDGRTAFVQKLHHSLTDGVGGIELALMLLDGERHPTDEASVPPAAPLAHGPDGRSSRRPAPPRWPAPVGAVRRSVARTFGAGLGLARSGLSAARNPLHAADLGAKTAVGAVRLLAPVRSSSPLLRERSLRRGLHMLEMPLEALHAAGHEAGCTVNDALLAAVASGLRRYHRRHGISLDRVAVTMPINLRRADDSLVGNHFTPARFTVPAALDDPVIRMRALGDVARSWQGSPALRMSDPLAGLLDRLPRPVTVAVFGSMLKGIDTVVTNVPGVPGPCYLAGASVEREFAFAPTGGAALNVALVSHHDVACIGVAVDLAAVPDDDVLIAELAAGFREVLAVGGAAHVSVT